MHGPTCVFWANVTPFSFQDKIGWTINAGDEILLAGGELSNATFQKYLQGQGVPLAAVGCEAWPQCNMNTLDRVNASRTAEGALLYYHSQVKRGWCWTSFRRPLVYFISVSP
jgi:hypothetical protein